MEREVAVKTAIQRALDDVVNRRRLPEAATVAEVVDEIDAGVVTSAQLAGLIVGLTMLARQIEKRAK